MNSNLNDKKTKVFIGLLALGLAVLIFFVVTSKPTSSTENTSNDDDSPFPVWLIPIWVAIFIPLLANKDKEKEELSSGQKKLVLLIVGLVVAIVVAILLFAL